jgi:hypothetical protein
MIQLLALNRTADMVEILKTPVKSGGASAQRQGCGFYRT